MTCQLGKVRNSHRFSHLRSGVKKKGVDIHGREQGQTFSGMKLQRLDGFSVRKDREPCRRKMDPEKVTGHCFTES